MFWNDFQKNHAFHDYTLDIKSVYMYILKKKKLMIQTNIQFDFDQRDMTMLQNRQITKE